MGQTRVMNKVRALTVLCSLVVAQPAGAATTVLTPVQDTSIFNGTLGSENFADGSGDFLWLSVTAEGLNRRMLVKFDLSAIPRGAVVQQVTLTLYESRARDEHDVAVHRLLASWGEGASNGGGQGGGVLAVPGDATWKHRFFPSTLWGQPGGDLVTAPSAVTRVGLPNATYSWGGVLPTNQGSAPPIVADVQRWVDDPASNHGWIFLGAESGNQNAKRFESRNNATLASRPTLTVVWAPPVAVADDTDVPVPLWAVGLLGLLLAGLRARRASPSS